MIGETTKSDSTAANGVNEVSRLPNLIHTYLLGEDDWLYFFGYAWSRVMLTRKKLFFEVPPKKKKSHGLKGKASPERRYRHYDCQRLVLKLPWYMEAMKKEWRRRKECSSCPSFSCFGTARHFMSAIYHPFLLLSSRFPTSRLRSRWYNPCFVPYPNPQIPSLSIP